MTLSSQHPVSGLPWTRKGTHLGTRVQQGRPLSSRFRPLASSSQSKSGDCGKPADTCGEEEAEKHKMTEHMHRSLCWTQVVSSWEVWF